MVRKNKDSKIGVLRVLPWTIQNLEKFVKVYSFFLKLLNQYHSSLHIIQNLDNSFFQKYRMYYFFL